MSLVRVASWNLFHGRAQPPVRADLLADYAAALAGADWEVCGVQECPPWFARPLADACGASLRVARTSLLRGALPVVQRCISSADPERLGVKGAAVNALLVRPAAGRITESHAATLRGFPQRRSVQAIRLERPAAPAPAGTPRPDPSAAPAGTPQADVSAAPAGTPQADPSASAAMWIGNVHTHNKPEVEAAIDLARAIECLRGWAGDEPAVLLGDLNVQPATARRIAEAGGFTWLAGDRVDHVLATPPVALAPATEPARSSQALRPRTLDGAAALSDHRLLLATLLTP